MPKKMQYLHVLIIKQNKAYFVKKLYIKQEAAFEEHRGFRCVLSAIDGCLIPVSVPRFCSENYVNRKGWHSVNLQAVCNHDIKFIDCYAGRPGCP